MNALLNNEFAPITTTIGFLETDMASATRAFWDWQQQLLQNESPSVSFEKKQVGGTLSKVLNTLLPLVSHEPCRHLFIPTNSSWVAYFNNLWQGTDPVSVISYLPTKIGCRGLLTRAIPDVQERRGNQPKQYGAVVLDLHGPEMVNYQNTIRSISVLNDGGKWKFFEEGIPFPFEETQQYKAERIQERFTIDMLQQYLQALGLAPFNEHYYLPAGNQSAVLIEKKGELSPVVKIYSLEEVQSMM